MSELNYAKTCQICKLGFITELMDRNCCGDCITLMKRLRSDGRLAERWAGFYLT